MVLLKNNADLLPLKNIKKIAVFGNSSYDLIPGGTGSGSVNKLYTVSLANGLANGGYSVDQGIQSDYTFYIAAAKASQSKDSFNLLNAAPPPAEMELAADRITRSASENDIAILSIGRNAGEGKDRKLENDYYLSASEKETVRQLSGAFHAQGKKLVIILNIGGVIEVASWRDEADAILLAWQPGMEGGNSMTDLLNGRINPSGKLACSFPVDYKDVPSAANFPGKKFKDRAKKGLFGREMVPAEVTYEEGVYVGYRYYNTFGVRTAYEFGYGLSYSRFTYSALQLSGPSADGTITLHMNISNSGATAGKEVVQIYLSAPRQRHGQAGGGTESLCQDRTLTARPEPDTRISSERLRSCLFRQQDLVLDIRGGGLQRESRRLLGGYPANGAFHTPSDHRRGKRPPGADAGNNNKGDEKIEWILNNRRKIIL